jgi:hypothetical protein
MTISDRAFEVRAEMHLGPGTIMPKSPMPETEFGMKSPRALWAINQCLYVAVEDPDAEKPAWSGVEFVAWAGP